MKHKLYIKYCRPYKNDHDEPPIEECWSTEDGQFPSKKLADHETMYVCDCIPGTNRTENERLWDGIE